MIKMAPPPPPPPGRPLIGTLSYFSLDSANMSFNSRSFSGSALYLESKISWHFKFFFCHKKSQIHVNLTAIDRNNNFDDIYITLHVHSN